MLGSFGSTWDKLVTVKMLVSPSLEMFGFIQLKKVNCLAWGWVPMVEIWFSSRVWAENWIWLLMSCGKTMARTTRTAQKTATII